MGKQMNVIFFGSDIFALPPLQALVSAGYKIGCVVTQPDRKKGRGLQMSFTPLKSAARELGLEFYQPDNVNTGESEKFLSALKPDLFVVIAYGQILSNGLLGIPKIFALNLHASLLPKYRGAAPINRAIINGDTYTGVTVLRMTEKMDAGPILAQKEVKITTSDNAGTLEKKLSVCGSELLLNALKDISVNRYSFIEQDEQKATMAPKLKKDDGLIDWAKRACDIYNLIRGCYGWPSAFTHYRKKTLKILSASVVQLPRKGSPGEVIEISSDAILAATGKDGLLIKELQIEGKRPMRAKEFLLGHRIGTGEIFS